MGSSIALLFISAPVSVGSVKCVITKGITMKRTYIITFIILGTVVFASAQQPTIPDTPYSDYGFGFGFSRMFSNKINITLADWERVGPKTSLGIVFSYGIDSNYGSTTHQGFLSIPVSFRVAEAGLVRFGVGFEFQSYNMGNDWGYYGTHTIGPTFDFTVPIPYKTSFARTGFTFGLGVDTVSGEGYFYSTGDEPNFIADIAFREKIQLYFSDRIGMNFAVFIPVQVGNGSHYVLDRAVVYFGPCFRW